MRNMNMLCAHIEYLWNQFNKLGRAVHMHLRAQSTPADLRRFLVEEWDRLPQNSVQRLVGVRPQLKIALVAMLTFC